MKTNHRLERPSMGRRQFIALASGLAAPRRPARPNIVVIQADDLGYGDLSCYGGSVGTPNIDELARRGMRFTKYHSGAAVCTPSRAALLTGRYANKVGVPVVLFPRDQYGISSALTFADHAKRRRYRTGMVGKWHLGHADRRYHPGSKGFSDLSEWAPWSNDMGHLPIYSGSDIVDDATDKAELLTKRFADHSIQFIESAKRSEPFLLYTAFIAPHWPPKASPEFAGATGRGPYADTITELDFHVGRMLKALRDNGHEENTLVIFTSDNGALRDPNLPGNMQGSNGPFAGSKFFLDEGGICVPCVMRWPGLVPENSSCDEFVSGMDIAPTIWKLAGASRGEAPPDFDGIDILPLMRGESRLPRDGSTLFFDAERLRTGIGRFADPSSGREFLAKAVFLDGGRARLFDLGTDLGERRDISPEYPGISGLMLADAKAKLASFPQSTRDANPSFA